MFSRSLQTFRDSHDVEALAQKTLRAFGAIHLLFNNAGIGSGNLLWESTLADWQWIISVNLGGLIYAIRVFIPLMLAQRTEYHIVNTASMAGLTSGPGTEIYSATKHAIVSISETLYHDFSLMHADVGVSVLCPGWVNTRILEQERNRPTKTAESAAPALAGATRARTDDVAAGQGRNAARTGRGKGLPGHSRETALYNHSSGMEGSHTTTYGRHSRRTQSGSPSNAGLTAPHAMGGQREVHRLYHSPLSLAGGARNGLPASSLRGIFHPTGGSHDAKLDNVRGPAPDRCAAACAAAEPAPPRLRRLRHAYSGAGRGALLRLSDRLFRVACVAGRLWATVDHSPTDHMLASGESQTFRGRGTVVIQALRTATARIELIARVKGLAGRELRRGVRPITEAAAAPAS